MRVGFTQGVFGQPYGSQAGRQSSKPSVRVFQWPGSVFGPRRRFGTRYRVRAVYRSPAQARGGPEDDPKRALMTQRGGRRRDAQVPECSVHDFVDFRLNPAEGLFRQGLEP